MMVFLIVLGPALLVAAAIGGPTLWLLANRDQESDRYRRWWWWIVLANTAVVAITAALSLAGLLNAAIPGGMLPAGGGGGGGPGMAFPPIWFLQAFTVAITAATGSHLAVFLLAQVPPKQLGIAIRTKLRAIFTLLPLASVGLFLLAWNA